MTNLQTITTILQIPLFFHIFSLLVLLTNNIIPTFTKKPPTNTFIVLSINTNTNQKLTNNITKTITFTINKNHKLNFLPKKKIQTTIKYSTPNKSKNYLFDNKYLHKIHLNLKTHQFIITRISSQNNQYQLIMTHITNKSNFDIITSTIIPKNTNNIINKTHTLLINILQKQNTTLIININKKDTQITINNKIINHNSLKIKIKPKTYTINISKKKLHTIFNQN